MTGPAGSGPSARRFQKPCSTRGLRRATVNQFIAVYNADLARYRQTVLSGFQQVEDSLAAVRILTQQIQQQHQAVESASVALDLETKRYESGIDPYIDVVPNRTRCSARNRSWR